MRRGVLLGAALSLPLTACAPGDEATGCIAVVVVDDARYYGDTAPDGPVPTTGSVSAMVPACHETPGADDPDERVEVHVIKGVSTAVAVLHEGVVHLREGRRLPASAAPWFASASCRGTEPVRLAGSWEGVTEPAAPHFDGVLDPPYDVILTVEDGPRRLLGETLEVQVTDDTSPVLARHDLRRLGSAGLTATTRCRGGVFIAVDIEVS